MRLMKSIGATLAAAALVAAGPAPASAASVDIAPGAWEPAPQAPFELPAGARCDFAVRMQPIVDEVRGLTVSTYPDGSPERVLYQGPLIGRLTNLETGATTTADASGSARVEYGTDGSMTWYVTGPVLVGFRENGGNLPKGLYIIDGEYILAFSPNGVKTLTMRHGTVHDLCTELA
ncbi:hypothetical protein ONA70_16200 [Micromonospora yasonensis]|uniref:hypothetical protein n=1 Tax=Micromonospora yasonensis TaxID=1128667 RepID=UPI002230C936|nr:hypothetical protein [Micromonospora yasonensis]MCW3841643.1 hypothetical protein [Micromonospora yasonensis]